METVTRCERGIYSREIEKERKVHRKGEEDLSRVKIDSITGSRLKINFSTGNAIAL